MPNKDLNTDASNDEVLIIPVPALVAVLLNKEKEKGSPLTENEVIEIRDNAACIAMQQHALDAIEKSRGYQDIDPEQVWEQWQVARTELLEDEN